MGVGLVLDLAFGFGCLVWFSLVVLLFWIVGLVCFVSLLFADFDLFIVLCVFDFGGLIKLMLWGGWVCCCLVLLGLFYCYLCFDSQWFGYCLM